MKFDKEVVIAIICCGLLLIFWEPLCRKLGWIPEQPAAVAAAAAAPADPTATATPAAAATAAVPATATPAPPQAAPAKLPEVKTQVLKNSHLALEINPALGAITGVELLDYKTSDRQADIRIDQAAAAKVGLQPLQHGALAIFAPGEKWQTVAILESSAKDANAYRLTRKIAAAGHGEFLITQKWELSPSDYRVAYQLTIANPGPAAMTFPRLVVSDGELQEWHAVSGDKMRSDSLRIDFNLPGGSPTDLAVDAKDTKFFQSAHGLEWVSLSNKYFITILRAKEPFTLYQARTVLAQNKDKYLATAGAEYLNFAIPAGSAKTLNFDFYAGPKVVSHLDGFAPATNRTMHLAWGPLDYLARLMLWALVHLKAICGSYGWSIVILTVIVRLLFWPITAKANASMKKMSTVQPKIQKLREQYKDNPQMLNAKTMELYREEKINPLGGCLPILLQIPVFFALYATLDGAVELRQVPFLWSHDLAAPDTIAHLPAFLFSLPINPLVIAMTLLMVLQQRLTPNTMEPMQQKMMLAMPIVMLFFLYDLPSGLTLYWTVSQIFSILQLLLQQKFSSNAATPAAGATK